MSSKKANGCHHGTGIVQFTRPIRKSKEEKNSCPCMLSSLLIHHGVAIADLGEPEPDWFQLASKKVSQKKKPMMSPCTSKLCFKTPMNPSLSAVFTQDGLFAPPSDSETSTLAHDTSYTPLLLSESVGELGNLWSPIHFSPKVLGKSRRAVSTPARMSASLGAKLDDSDMVWSSSLATPLAIPLADESTSACDKAKACRGNTPIAQQNNSSSYKSSVRTALTYSPLPCKTTVAANKDLIYEDQPFPLESTRQDEVQLQKRRGIQVISSPVHSSVLSQDCVDFFEEMKQDEHSDESALDISNRLHSTGSKHLVGDKDFVEDANESSTPVSASRSKLKQKDGNFDITGNTESNLTTSLEFLFMTPPVQSYSQQCRRKRKRSSNKSKRVDIEDDNVLSALVHGKSNISFDDDRSDVPSEPHGGEIETEKNSSVNRACNIHDENDRQTECLISDVNPETIDKNYNKCFADDEEIVSSSCAPLVKCSLKPGPTFSTPKVEGNKFTFGPHRICTQMTNENIAVSQEFFATVPLSSLHEMCHASESALEISAVGDPETFKSPRTNVCYTSDKILVVGETHARSNKILPGQQTENLIEMQMASIIPDATGLKRSTDVEKTTCNPNAIALSPIAQLQRTSVVSSCKPSYKSNTCHRFVYPTVEQIIKEYPEQVLHLHAMPSSFANTAILTADAEAISIGDNENTKYSDSLAESASKSRKFRELSGRGTFLSLNSYNALLPAEEQVQKLDIKEARCDAFDSVTSLSTKVKVIASHTAETNLVSCNVPHEQLSERATLQTSKATPANTSNNNEQPVLDKMPQLQHRSSEMTEKKELGFKLASGKVVNISQDSLETARELWDSTVAMNSSFFSSGDEGCEQKQQLDHPPVCDRTNKNHSGLTVTPILPPEVSSAAPILPTKEIFKGKVLVNCNNLAEQTLLPNSCKKPQLKVAVKKLDVRSDVSSLVTGNSVDKKYIPYCRLTASQKQKNANDTDDGFLSFGEVSMTEVLEVAESTYACLQAMELDEVAVAANKNSITENACVPPHSIADSLNKAKSINDSKREQTVLQSTEQTHVSVVEPNKACFLTQTVNCNKSLQLVNIDGHVDQDVCAVLEQIVAGCCDKEVEQDELACAGFNKEELLGMCFSLSGFCSSQWKPGNMGLQEDKKTDIISSNCLAQSKIHSSSLSHNIPDTGITDNDPCTIITGCDQINLGSHRKIYQEDNGVCTLPSNDVALGLRESAPTMCGNTFSEIKKEEISCCAHSQNKQHSNTEDHVSRKDILSQCTISDASVVDSSRKKRFRKISENDSTNMDKTENGYIVSAFSNERLGTENDRMDSEAKRSCVEEIENITVAINNEEMKILSPEKLLHELCETVAINMDKIENGLLSTALLSLGNEDDKQHSIQELPSEELKLNDKCVEHTDTMAEKAITDCDVQLVRHDISIVPEVNCIFDDSFTAIAETIPLSMDTLKSLVKMDLVSDFNQKTEEADVIAAPQVCAIADIESNNKEASTEPLRSRVTRSDECVKLAIENQQHYTFAGINNKPVPISPSNTLGYTKRLFSKVKDNITSTEKQKCLKPSICTVDAKDTQLNSNIPPNDENRFEGNECCTNDDMETNNAKDYFDENINVEQISKRSFGGFCTAGAKIIQVSDDALMNAKKIFDERGESTNLDVKSKLPYTKNSSEVRNMEDEVSIGVLKSGNNNENMPATESTKQSMRELPSAVRVSTDFVTKTKKLSANQCVNVTEINISKRMFGGFSTASGKNVQVSESALQKAKMLFAECDEKDDVRKQNCPDEGKVVENLIEVPNIDQDSIAALKYSKSSKEDEYVPMDESTKLFHDALPVSVQVITDTVKTRKIHAECLGNVNKIPKELFGGFSTASGKNVQVSESALQKAKMLFAECDEKDDVRKQNCPDEGKVVENLIEVPNTDQDSIAALKYSKSSKEDEYVPVDESTKLSHDALPVSVQVITDTVKTRKTHAECLGNVNKIPKELFGGFSTASGKNVHVSKEALRKAKIIFVDCDETNDIHGRNKTDDGTLVENSVELSSNKKASTAVVNYGKNFEEAMDANTRCFGELPSVAQVITDPVTGIRKPYADSREAESVTHVSKIFGGFSTANGKNVLVSEEALKKAKLFLAESYKKSDIQEQNHLKEGKLVESSDESSSINFEKTLNQSPLGDVSKHKPMFNGFCTAGGRSIPVSEDALRNAKTLFNDSDEISLFQQKSDAAFGFSTADGKRPCISEMALRNAKKCFGDICEDVSLTKDLEVASGRFPVIGNKVVPISGKTLNCNQHSETSERGEDMRKEQPLKVCGFSTAAGKGVNISNDALERAKKLFNEINEDGSEKELPKESSSDGKILPTTAEGMKETEAKFQKDIQNIDLKANTNFSFGGFSTASGKNIQISEDSLKHAKQLFNDSEVHDQDQVLFSTESRSRTVQASEKCLKTLPIATDEVEEVSNLKEISRRDPANDSLIRTERARAAKYRSLANGITDSEIDESMAAFLADEADCSNMSSDMMLDVENKNKTAVTYWKDQDNINSNQPLLLNQLEAVSVADCVPEDGIHFKRAQIAAREKQAAIIKSKQSSSVKPIDGKHWLIKSKTTSEKRISMKEAVGGRFPETYNKDELIFFGVRESVLRVNSSCAEEFKFTTLDFSNSKRESAEIVTGELVLIPDEANSFGKKEFCSALLASPGVDPNLIDNAWVYNHFRWIVWKFAAMEVAFPHQFAGQCLVPEEVAAQLKYRYNKEIDHSQRSALKRILERDDSAAKTLVLCVSNIISVEKSSLVGEGDKLQSESETTLEVTDGWYSMRAVLDEPLKHLIKNKKIIVGQKLIIHGAELIGSCDACNPLEIPSNLFLKLAANSTRRAHWSLKLGFFKSPQPFLIPLSSVFGNGGAVGCIQAVVARVYSVQYMEKLHDACIFRNEKAEAKAAACYEEHCRTLKEKLFNDVVKQFEKEEAKKVKKLNVLKPGLKIENLQSGEEVHRFLDLCDDPASLVHLLTSSQQSSFTEYSTKLLETRQVCLQTEFQKQLLKEQEEGTFPQDRVVIPFVRILLAGISAEGKQNKVCTLTIWRPMADYDQILKEGCPFRFFYLMASNYNRNNAGFQLATTRRTTYEPIAIDPSILESVYFPRKICSFEDLQNSDFHAPYSEVDVVGLVVSVSNSGTTVDISQMVYLADKHMDMISVKVWIDKYGVDEALQVGNVIAACNLQIRQRKVSGYISLLHTSEVSTFSQHPRKKYLQLPLEHLKTVVKNDSRFASNAANKLSNVLCAKNNLPNITSEMESRSASPNAPTSERVSVASPLHLAVKTPTSLKSDVSHLKESPYGRYPNELLSWTDKLCTSEEAASNAVISPTAQNSRTQSKFSWLQRVGLPPPISPLAVPIPNTLRKSFKSPFRTDPKSSTQRVLAMLPSGDSKKNEVSELNAGGVNPECVVLRRDSPPADSPPMDLS